MTSPAPLTTEELLLSLPRPIAIVGNGTPGRDLGAAIDRHASVIRINNYRIAGHEAQVGTRTTLRCTSGWHDIEGRGDHPECSPFTTASPESAGLPYYQRRNPGLAAVATPSADIHTLLPHLPKPSTGLALVTLCASLGLEVSVFGFDGFATPHYWESTPIDTTHDAREIEVLLSLPGVTLYGASYDYASLYDFCHSAHQPYSTNEGLELYRRLGLRLRGERLIEFGAGNGGLSAHLAREGNDVTAVEVSPVAFRKIPVAHKINGDALTLCTLEDHWDRFVCMDVLEHLTENDLRIVVREAARLADRVLLSISTRPSGLLGPKGENLHLTVRPADWWKALLAPWFDVTLSRGTEFGQVLIEGVRRDPARPVETGSRPDDRFELPAGYQARPTPTYYVDADDDGVEWQPDVYPAAASLARSLGCDTLIDIGCGQARKLMRWNSEFRTVGVDFGANIEHCRRLYPKQLWLEADFETVSLLPLADAMLARSVLICSDVIEHLRDPRALLGVLRELLQRAPALVLSTPDRVRTHGPRHAGPPPNPAHVREWAPEELARLLEREGFQLATVTHTRSNDRDQSPATILVVATNPRHPALQDSELAQNASAPRAQAPAAPVAAPTPLPAAAVRPAVPAGVATADDETDLAEARAALDRADIAVFEAAMERLFGRDPEHHAARLLLAELQLLHGSVEDAAWLFESLLARDAEDARALEGAVLARLRLGDRRGARDLLQAVVPA